MTSYGLGMHGGSPKIMVREVHDVELSSRLLELTCRVGVATMERARCVTVLTGRALSAARKNIACVDPKANGTVISSPLLTQVYIPEQ